MRRELREKLDALERKARRRNVLLAALALLLATGIFAVVGAPPVSQQNVPVTVIRAYIQVAEISGLRSMRIEARSEDGRHIFAEGSPLGAAESG